MQSQGRRNVRESQARMATSRRSHVGSQDVASMVTARLVPTVRTVRGEIVYTPTENNEALARLDIALRRDDAQAIEQAIVMLAQTDSGASILATLTKVCATHVIRSIDLMSIGQ
jgi:hypothetical protein